MQPQRKAELFLVLTTFIAAWGWVFSREAVQGMPIFGFLGTRFCLRQLSCYLFATVKRIVFLFVSYPRLL